MLISGANSLSACWLGLPLSPYTATETVCVLPQGSPHIPVDAAQNQCMSRLAYNVQGTTFGACAFCLKEAALYGLH